MITILSIILLAARATFQQDCVIDTEAFVGNSFVQGSEPILLNPETLEFVYPTRRSGDARFVIVPEGTQIMGSCGRTTFYNEHPDSPDSKTFIVNCTKNANSLFEDNNNQLYKMEDIYCYTQQLEVVTVVPDETCAEGQGTIIKVGFPVTLRNTTVPLYEVCFDLQAKNMLYGKYIVTEVQRYQANRRYRDYTIEDEANFYNFTSTVQSIYFFRQQTINDLLGLPVNSTKYFQSTTNTAEASYDIVQERLVNFRNLFYLSQEGAASRLFNTVPLWDINTSSENNNWYNIIYGMSKISADKRVNLVVYSGTYGVATLPHEETKEDVELYLYPYDGLKAIPVPKLLWHLMYHPEQQKAIVLVAVNNPFVVKESDRVCKDVSNTYHWDRDILKKKNNEYLGVVYACTYEDFKKVVTFLPELEVKGVLSSSNHIKFSVFIVMLSLILLKIQ